MEKDKDLIITDEEYNELFDYTDKIADLQRSGYVLHERLETLLQSIEEHKAQLQIIRDELNKVSAASEKRFREVVTGYGVDLEKNNAHIEKQSPHKIILEKIKKD